MCVHLCACLSVFTCVCTLVCVHILCPADDSRPQITEDIMSTTRRHDGGVEPSHPKNISEQQKANAKLNGKTVI